MLLTEVYPNQGSTFYCNCPWKDKRVDYSMCFYKPKNDSKRSRSVEVEHVVPAHKFGSTFKEWTEGSPLCVDKHFKPYKGRKCAQTNAEYSLMEADMYNLYPVVGELNMYRSNKPIGVVPGEERVFGSCDIEFSKDTFEPADRISGDIARVYLYMAAVYQGRVILTPQEIDFIKYWDRFDPPDAEECSRARAIRSLQGNINPILEDKCPK